jgi:hypothetical protein
MSNTDYENTDYENTDYNKQINDLNSILGDLREKITKEQFNELTNKIIVSLKDCHTKLCNSKIKNQYKKENNPNDDSDDYDEEIDFTENKLPKNDDDYDEEIDFTKKKEQNDNKEDINFKRDDDDDRNEFEDVNLTQPTSYQNKPMTGEELNKLYKQSATTPAYDETKYFKNVEGTRPETKTDNGDNGIFGLGFWGLGGVRTRRRRHKTKKNNKNKSKLRIRRPSKKITRKHRKTKHNYRLS